MLQQPSPPPVLSVLLLPCKRDTDEDTDEDTIYKAPVGRRASHAAWWLSAGSRMYSQDGRMGRHKKDSAFSLEKLL